MQHLKIKVSVLSISERVHEHVMLPHAKAFYYRLTSVLFKYSIALTGSLWFVVGLPSTP